MIDSPSLCRLMKEWNKYRFKSFNIEIVEQTFQPFFEVSELPPPQIDNSEEILTTESYKETRCDEAYQLLRKLFYASSCAISDKAAVDDFAVELFKTTHYTGRALERVTATRVELPFTVCGKQLTVTVPVCLMDAEGMVILVYDSYGIGYFNFSSGEAPIIAYAIAAFKYNNGIRTLQGKEILEEQTIAGIKMNGTLTEFYKIPVTSSLTRAVQDGYHPVTRTSVSKCYLCPNDPSMDFRQGMCSRKYRHVILSCYEAFKRFVQSPTD